MDEIYRQRNQLFVDALRSGQYRQGRRALNIKNNDYCCLGVACEVAIQNGLKLTKHESSTGDLVTYNGAAFLPPVEVMQWYGWSRSNPTLHGNRCSTALNDELGYTFAMIADSFERTYCTEENN